MKKKRTAGGWKSRRVNFNKPPDGESWIWLTQEMLESSAWRAMSFAARKIIDRLIVEHLAHAGTENGNLISTYSDFEKFEIRRRSIPRAIVAAETLGFIDVIKRGGSAYADLRFPSIYSLAWLPRKDGTAPTTRWKAFQTRAEAREAVRGALKIRRSKNKKPGAKTPLVPGAKTPLVGAKAGGENAPSRPKSRGRKRPSSLESSHSL